MNVLVLNVGSSSLKFDLIDINLESIASNSARRLCRGIIDKIGMTSSTIKLETIYGEAQITTAPVWDHSAAIRQMLKSLKAEADKLDNPPQIDAVGHRIVHGGEYFAQSVLISDEVVARIKDCFELAPLHNPHNLCGYELLHQALPEVPHVAVFDTAFHQTMPPHAYLYALPYSLYQKHKVRRYGFHGISHRYLIYTLERSIAKRPRAEFRAITMHLGNGCSMAAVDGGRSIDTSMGFTPLEGLVMGTRCGDVDPAVILHVIAKEEITLHEMNTMLNKFSGLTAISGTSNDVRELTRLAENGDPRALLALQTFSYRARKYVGAYLAALGGAHYIAIAGGIGENSPLVRSMIFENLGALGIQFSPESNRALGKEGGEITTPDSPVRAFVIPTDEELIIARDTVRCISANAIPPG